MEFLWEGIREGFRLLFTGNREVIEITLRSLLISGSAILIALVIGALAGYFLAIQRFWGRNFVLSLVNTGMGLPPVVVGLFVAIMLWRSGPLGLLNMMYTPGAMIVAQAVLATPIVTGFTVASIQSLHPKLRLQIMALGASRWQTIWLLLREARLPLLAGVMAGFGAAISEVGASLMVGGNIEGSTRVLTTATVLETAKGNFEMAIALSVVLLILIYSVNLVLTFVQQRQRPA